MSICEPIVGLHSVLEDPNAVYKHMKLVKV